MLLDRKCLLQQAGQDGALLRADDVQMQPQAGDVQGVGRSAAVGVAVLEAAQARAAHQRSIRVQAAVVPNLQWVVDTAWLGATGQQQ